MKKIIIAEDDHILLSVYEEAFKLDKFEIKTAKDGVETLKVLKTFVPDVILLDLVMPVKSGFDVLEAMKNIPHLKSVCIIVATNLANDEDKNKAISMGAKDYFIKSELTPQEIINRVKKLL